MLDGQFGNEATDIVSPRPNAAHDDVTWRSVHGDRPWTILVVVDSLLGNVIDLWVVRDQLIIEGGNGGVLNNVANIALAQTSVALPRFLRGQDPIWVPNAEVTTHGGWCG